MIFWVIQWSILSLIFIYLLHHLYSFFIDTLTVPKVKDLVNKPLDRYNELLNAMQKNKQGTQNTDMNIINNNQKHHNQAENNNMHNELLDFLNNIKKNSSNTQTDLNSFNDTNYSMI